MEWIGRAHGDSRVVWSGRELGRWQQVVTGWRSLQGKIQLALEIFGRRHLVELYWARPEPWGATLAVRSPGRPGRERIHVFWLETEAQALARHELVVEGLQAWIRERWSGCVLERVIRRSERAHSLSGRYVRALVHHQGIDRVLMAETDEGAGDRCSSLLTQTLLWISRLRGAPTNARQAHLFVPAGQGEALRYRSAFLDPRKVSAEVWEYEMVRQRCWHAVRMEGAAPPEEYRNYRWPAGGPFRWSEPLARVLALAPSLIRRHPRLREYDSLRLLGLEFARACGRGRDRILFGIGAFHQELNDANFVELEKLVAEILYYRRPDSPDTRHPHYRAQSERWLECLILDGAAHLFPELVPHCVYPQIPVYLGGWQGRLDILALDRDGTLVVMELKLDADPDLPLQALDYWGRVIHHNRNGDFEKRGYFSGLRLTRCRPKLYLVAPVFSFHDSTERILHFLDPQLEVCKISINEDWRSGVRILQRVQYRCGDIC